ncbi:MAG: GNAT family N-acetyltransferase [Patescibacteria group bacterium]|nr:GNAT family N-acetyltransferase [Patescibacteria group bacterium]
MFNSLKFQLDMTKPLRPASKTSGVEKQRIGKLGEFDMKYFKSLPDEYGKKDSWIAIGQENCCNQKYFTVFSDIGERLGIIGVYNLGEDKNITHTVVDPKYRGQDLAGRFKEMLMEKLGLPFVTLIINLDNQSSIRAAEKIQGVEKLSGFEYEKEFHKVRYRLTKSKDQD